MKQFLTLLFLFPFSLYAEGFYVQDNLAEMVEDVVRLTNMKINIPDMDTKYVRINKVDGMDVCSQEARPKVLKLQSAFNQHPHMFRTKSIHGTYTKQANGKIIRSNLKPFSQTADLCESITVTVR